MKAITGEGQSLMMIAGQGEVFLADTAQDVLLFYLQDDKTTDHGQRPQCARLRRRQAQEPRRPRLRGIAEMAFGGQGWGLVQPSEGRIMATAQSAG